MGKPHALAEHDKFRGNSKVSQDVAGNCPGRLRKIPRGADRPEPGDRNGQVT